MSKLTDRWRNFRLRGMMSQARKRRRVRIAILGWYGSPNVGDEAELTAILHRLRGERDIRITVMSTNPAVTQAQHPTVRVVNRALLRGAAWRTLMGSKALVLGGGGLLQDRSSFYNLPVFVLYLLLARLFGKKVMLWGIGAEPLATGFGRWLVRRAVQLSHVITLRDEVSADLLRLAHANERKWRVTTDPAIGLIPASDEQLATFLEQQKIMLGEQPTIALCLRKPPDDHPGFNLSYFLTVSLRERLTRASPKARGRNAYFTKAMANLADHYAGQYGARLLFVPFWGGRDDDFAKKVVAQMRHADQAKVIEGIYPPALLQALLGRMDGVVAMRLHSAVFAATQSVPPLAITYASKVRGFMQSVGLEEYSLSMERLDQTHATTHADQLWAERATLSQQVSQRVAALQASSNERELLRGLLKLK